jgi:hypothetical protein
MSRKKPHFRSLPSIENPAVPYLTHKAKKVDISKFREAFYYAVSLEDMIAVVRELVRQARGGSLPAIHELLDRILGKPTQISHHTRETQNVNWDKMIGTLMEVLGPYPEARQALARQLLQKSFMDDLKKDQEIVDLVEEFSESE